VNRFFHSVASSSLIHHYASYHSENTSLLAGLSRPYMTYDIFLLPTTILFIENIEWLIFWDYKQKKQINSFTLDAFISPINAPRGRGLNQILPYKR